MAVLLLVDDDQDFASIIEDVLVSDSHQVDLAYDGIDGLAKLCFKEYDLAIVDWDMPGLTGPGLCRKFRETGGSTPLIILTGKTDIESRLEGLNSGADDYLSKPFHPKELTARVQILLRRSQRLTLGIGSEPCPETSLRDNPRMRITTTRTGKDLPSFACALSPGDTFQERYEIEGVRAIGGMSVVYSAKQKFLERPVAIKVMLGRLGESDVGLKRFQREAQLVAQLKHPHIVTIVDFGFIDSGTAFYVMDLIGGISIAEILQQERQLEPARTIRIFLQICEAVRCIQASGMLHRDIKASNVMLSRAPDGSDHAILIDFGLAKVLTGETDEHDKLTKSGETFGTAYYMSPEQCKGDELDFRSDVYALGCLLYECLTGTTPFVGKNLFATMQLQINTNPVPCSAIRADLGLHPVLDRIVLKCLEKRPEYRYQSIGELVAALSQQPH